MMTTVFLINRLAEFVETATSGLKLPTSLQKGDIDLPEDRAPLVFRMRLPKSEAAKKYVPYVIVQLVSTENDLSMRGREVFTATVRFICAVYSEQEDEGQISLLNLMDTINRALIENTEENEGFQLDRKEGINMYIYPDDITPYYAGELLCDFIIPSADRRIDFLYE